MWQHPKPLKASRRRNSERGMCRCLAVGMKNFPLKSGMSCSVRGEVMASPPPIVQVAHTPVSSFSLTVASLDQVRRYLSSSPRLQVKAALYWILTQVTDLKQLPPHPPGA